MSGEIDQLLRQGDAEAAAQLLELGESGDRDIRKAARRALFTLKQRGIEPPKGPARREPGLPPKSPPSAVRSAYVTQPGGNGSRMLIFIRDDPYGGSPTMLSFLVNDETGVVDLGHRRMPRLRIEETLDKFRAKETTVLAEVPVDYARWLLQQTVRQNTVSRNPVPPGFAERQKATGPPQSDYSSHPVYAALDSDAIRKDLSISRSPDHFLKRPAFRGWILGIESIEPLKAKLGQLEHSPLVLDESAKRHRMDRLLDDVADEIFSPETIGIWKLRLEESAYTLERTGQNEPAKEALYHAITLDPNKPAHLQPFLLELARRSLAVYHAMEETDEEIQPPGLIERI